MAPVSRVAQLLDLRRRGAVSAAMSVALLSLAGWAATVAWTDLMAPSAPVFLALWTAMMAAMMLPSAAPFIVLYRRSAEAAQTATLTAGYLLVWAVLGGLAYVYVQSGITVASWVVFGAAGLYQLTPLKAACLRRCRTPADFLILRWGRDPLSLGLEHGAWCAGCCWALMVVLVVAGSMGLAWVAGLAVLVLVEKRARQGVVIARVTGVVFVALALTEGLTEGVFGWPGI